MSTNIGFRIGTRFTIGIGFRYAVLSYSLTLENPGREVFGAPLVLDRADVRTFAVLGTAGWRF